MAPLPPKFDLDEVIDRRLVPALKTHSMVLGKDGAELFAAGVADMDFRVAPPIIDAIQIRLEHGVFGYEAVPDGLYPALIRWLDNRHGWQVDQTHILRAPNVLNILAIAASLFTASQDGIIVQPPVFFDFYDIIQENDRRLVQNPLILRNGTYSMDFEGLEALASNPRNKMLYLCNPHNPVGRVWTKEELRRLGEICNRNGILVVSDEIHGDITFAPHRYTPFASLGREFAANAITCLSPAKSFNIASCCSAFTVITDDQKRSAFQVENSRLTVNKNNAFASAAMQAAYEDGGPWLDEVLEYLDGNLGLVRARLQKIPNVTLIEPDGTFLLWLDLRDLNLDPEALTLFLREKAGWAVTRGPAFGQDGTGFARLNIGCAKSKLAVALDQLAAAVCELAQ